MIGFLTKLSRQQLAFFLSCVLMTSLVYSKFVLSLSMILLIVLALLSFDENKKFPFYFNPAIKKNFQLLFENKAYLVVFLYFFLVLFSGVYSEDMTYFAERLRIRLPFLILPFAFASIPSFTSRQYLSLFYFLVVLMFVSSVQVGLNYYLHYDEINKSMTYGRAIPTPMNHIRFSLVLAFSILGGTALFVKKFYLKYKWERYVILGMTVFLFGFIHVLSVRSGLIVLYLSIAFLSLRFIYQTKKISIGIAMIASLILIPILAFKFIPSFKTKVSYVKHDLDMYLSGKSQSYSDAERIISLQVGLKIGKDNKLIGVGAGDLKKEVTQIYKSNYPKIKHEKMPHNQFISVFAGTGMLGLIVFIFAFIFPLFYQHNYRDALFFSLHVIIFFSFMVENTIETSIGTAFYVFFLLLGINYLSGRGKISDSSALE